MISLSSSTASSSPATSANVVWGMSLVNSTARDLPTPNSPPLPPCIRDMKKNSSPNRMSMGSRNDSICDRKPCWVTAVSYFSGSAAATRSKI